MYFIITEYTDIMGKSCSGEDEDDEGGDGEEETLSFQVS